MVVVKPRTPTGGCRAPLNFSTVEQLLTTTAPLEDPLDASTSVVAPRMRLRLGHPGASSAPLPWR